MSFSKQVESVRAFLEEIATKNKSWSASELEWGSVGNLDRSRFSDNREHRAVTFVVLYQHLRIVETLGCRDDEKSRPGMPLSQIAQWQGICKLSRVLRLN